MKPTTRNVLDRLRVAPATTHDLCQPEVGGIRFGGRIKELRDLGYVIDRKRVREGSHLYTLIAEPEEGGMPNHADKRRATGQLSTMGRDRQVMGAGSASANISGTHIGMPGREHGGYTTGQPLTSSPANPPAGESATAEMPAPSDSPLMARAETLHDGMSMSDRYRTIVVDPPWAYEEGFPQGPARGLGRSTVRLPYKAMTLDEIAQIPVGEIAASHAWLFLWTTNKYLPASFPLIEGWGFTYRQTITWRKTGCPSPFVTSIAPQHSEFLLVARRGKPDRIGAFPSTVIDAPAQTRHSAKPEAFLDFIEASTPRPRAELFARRARLGWDYPIGDQALGGMAA